VVQLADGLAGVVAHPVQTAQGVGALVDRVAQTTPQGRALELLFEAAYGKYETPGQLLAAFQDRTDPLAVAKAQVDLAADVGRGMFAESIRLAREGRYEEAAGTALGQNADMLFGAGMVGRGGKLRAAVEAVEEAGTAGRATSAAGRAAEATGRVADAAGDAARGLGRGLETEGRAATEAATEARQAVATTTGAVEGTRAAEAADRIAPKRIAGPGTWVEKGRRGGPSLEHQSRMSGQEIVIRDGKYYVNEYEVRAGDLKASFDDFRDGVLIDYKGDYSSFIGQDGLFTRKPWFRGTGMAGLREEAISQLRIAHARGLPVVWHVGEAQVKAFHDVLRDIPGITIKP